MNSKLKSPCLSPVGEGFCKYIVNGLIKNLISFGKRRNICHKRAQRWVENLIIVSDNLSESIITP